VNDDLYVSPWGDDSNTGLNEDEPLQTIAYAMQIIEPDSLEPKTIHLEEGTYSYSQNEQIFPFAMKSDIRLQGAGIENTIFDAEYYSSILIIMNQHNVHVSDINIIDCRSTSLTGVSGCQYSEDIVFKNILIENCLCSSTSGLSFSRNTGIIVENVIVRDAANDEYSTIGIHDYSNDITINNVIIDNLSIVGDAGSEVGLFLSFSDVSVRNTIISNCSAHDAYLIDYQNIEEITSANNLDLTNTLIFNNNITYTSWAFVRNLSAASLSVNEYC